MTPSLERTSYYRANLARIHHEGFGFHTDACAPGILELLRDLDKDALIVELGCGSGLLTRHLVDAGHRVLATDASPAMLELARKHVEGTVELRQLVLPEDPIPPADAIVSLGHVLSYLSDESSIRRGFAVIAEALRPRGILAVDLCDLEWGRVRKGEAPKLWKTDNWVLFTEFSLPETDRYVRQMTMFVRDADGMWHRDAEKHDNTLIDTSFVPPLLAEHGVTASIRPSFGEEQLPAGLVAIVGRKAD